jgi:hypothetical protein
MFLKVEKLKRNLDWNRVGVGRLSQSPLPELMQTSACCQPFLARQSFKVKKISKFL